MNSFLNAKCLLLIKSMWNTAGKYVWVSFQGLPSLVEGRIEKGEGNKDYK